MWDGQRDRPGGKGLTLTFAWEDPEAASLMSDHSDATWESTLRRVWCPCSFRLHYSSIYLCLYVYVCVDKQVSYYVGGGHWMMRSIYCPVSVSPPSSLPYEAWQHQYAEEVHVQLRVHVLLRKQGQLTSLAAVLDRYRRVSSSLDLPVLYFRLSFSLQFVTVPLPICTSTHNLHGASYKSWDYRCYLRCMVGNKMWSSGTLFLLDYPLTIKWTVACSHAHMCAHAHVHTHI